MTRLEEIRARWEKVTPGPWRWSNTSSEAYLFGARSLVVMAFKRMGMNGAQPVFRREDNILYPAGKENINAFPDAQAIATAPEDIAFLLAKLADPWDLEGNAAATAWKARVDAVQKWAEQEYGDASAFPTGLVFALFGSVAAELHEVEGTVDANA